MEKPQSFDESQNFAAMKQAAIHQAARIVARAQTAPASLFSEITEASIEQQVRRFYGRVLLDDTLAPIFMKAIPGDWEPHLSKMFAFWSSVMLTSGRYKGNPFMAHARHKAIEKEHFAVWLDLWTQTSSALFEPNLAATFQAKARNIASALTAGLFILPKSSALSFVEQ